VACDAAIARASQGGGPPRCGRRAPSPTACGSGGWARPRWAGTALLDAIDHAATAAAADLAAARTAKAANVGEIEQRVARMADLRRQLADTRTQAGILTQAAGAAASGLTDLPLWLVQAFTEHGWQWGEWPGFSDAMHFDHMGPVADVVSQ
jgi:hypothetical protein